MMHLGLKHTDKFWLQQDVNFGFKADVIETGNQSEQPWSDFSLIP